MSNDTTITIIGNLTAAPELRFTPNGVAVANFTVAASSRMFDRHTGQWRDADAVFMRCNVWREPAENVVETLNKGTRVIVSGRLRQRTYVTREKERRTVTELEVDEIGASLRYAVANMVRVERNGAARREPTPVPEATEESRPDTGTDPFATEQRHLAAVPELVGAGAGSGGADGEPPF